MSMVSLGIASVIVSSTITQAKYLPKLSETHKVKLVCITSTAMGGICLVQMSLVEAFGSTPAAYLLPLPAFLVSYVMLVPMVRDEGAVRCDHLCPKSQGKASGVLTSTRGIGLAIAPICASALFGWMADALCCDGDNSSWLLVHNDLFL
jgi:hypothetical protein